VRAKRPEINSEFMEGPFFLANIATGAGKRFVDTVEPMEVSVSRGKIPSQRIVQPALFDFVFLSHSFSRFLEICPPIMGHSRSRKRRSLGFRDFEIDSIGMECEISKLWSK